MTIAEYDLQRRAERLSLEELEQRIEGCQSRSMMGMFTEQWGQHHTANSEIDIYYRVYRRRGGKKELTRFKFEEPQERSNAETQGHTRD